MVMITLYAIQQKRHTYIEQFFGLYGRGRGWGDLGEWHWNMYNIIYETNRHSKFDAWYWLIRAGTLGRPKGMVRVGMGEGGFRMGNTCIPVADSCWCMAEWKCWLKAQHSENKDHGILSHHFMGNRWGNSGKSVRLYYLGLQNHCRGWLQPWN